MSASKNVSRRDFLRLAGLAAAGTAIAACATPTPQIIRETVIVEKEKIVQQTVVVEKVATKIVEKEKLVSVEKLVTPTALPAVTTLQGKVLPADAAPIDKQVSYQGGGENKHLDVARDLYSANMALHYGGEPLLWRNVDLELIPVLAQDLPKAGPKASYYDFTIREGAKWSDGVPISADDWVWTGWVYCDPELDNPWSWFFYDIAGMQAWKEGKGKKEDVGIKKIDDRTIRVIAEKGSAPHIPALMSYQSIVPSPKHKAEKDKFHWADTIENFVSSGPMIPTKWEHNKRMEWDLHKYYNGPGKPGFQKNVQLIGAGGNINDWLTGVIDIFGVGAADVVRFRSDPKLNPLLHWVANFQTCWFSLNPNRAPLDNINLRKALCKSFDRETYIVKVTNMTALPAYTMLPPGFPSYNMPENKPYQDFNVEEAKKYLADAGYKDGKDAKGKQLVLKLQTTGAGVVYDFLKEQWERNLGIKLEIEVLEGSVFNQRRGPGGKYDLDIFWGCYEYDYIDPSNMLTALWRSTTDLGGYRYPVKIQKFDDLVNAAGVETDMAKSDAMYKQAEKVLLEDYSLVFVSHAMWFYAWWPWLKGVAVNKLGIAEYRGLEMGWNSLYADKTEGQYRKPH